MRYLNPSSKLKICMLRYCKLIFSCGLYHWIMVCMRIDVLWCTTRRGLNSKKQIVSSASLAVVFVLFLPGNGSYSSYLSLSYHMLIWGNSSVWLFYSLCLCFDRGMATVCGRHKPQSTYHNNGPKVRTIIMGKEQGELKGDLVPY